MESPIPCAAPVINATLSDNIIMREEGLASGLAYATPPSNSIERYYTCTLCKAQSYVAHAYI